MCSTPMGLQPVTMTAKPLTHAASDDRCRPVHGKPEADHHVYMNWVVVNDTNGKRLLQMHWRVN